MTLTIPRCLILLALLAASVGSSCEELQMPLDDPSYCPADPMTAECPRGTCSGPYECISYCIRYFPEGESIPAAGMGAWCDDARVPELGGFCRDNPGVVGCPQWCDDHPGECDGGTDGDGDSDIDGDGDGDLDADGDGDSDGDTEADCEDHDDCSVADTARCQDGLCVACDADEHCESVEGLPACQDGICYECTADNTAACAGETPLCDTERNRCATCIDAGDCTGPEASRCAEGVCVACEGNDDCTHLPGLPACEDGVCYQCTELHTSECSDDTPMCNAEENRCVECIEQAHCTSTTESQCSDGMCAACSADDHCTHIPDLPACNDGTCVECTAESTDACTDGTPYCHADSNNCVACLDHTHCTDPAAAQCSPTHACEPCSDNTHCDGVEGLPICDDTQCVECTLYAHCPSGEVCNYTTQECVAACRECNPIDDDCAEVLGAGFICERNGVATSLWRCFQSSASCERPWIEVRGICLPPETTSCEGVTEFGEECVDTDPCGVDEISGDGFCTDGERNCTYFCTVDLECPADTTCSGVPLVCR